MRTVVTTEKISLGAGVRVLGISALGKEMARWVRKMQREQFSVSPLPERMAAAFFAHFEEPPVRQAYFQIRGRSYFLDFFFPASLLAVEIDGSVHKYKKEHDRKRDADFRSIGIRTIRIKNKDVMAGKLNERLFKALYK